MMGKFLLGQHLSERWFEKGPDPLKTRVWLALRYLILVASAVIFAIMVDRSPGGAILLGIGSGLLLTALVDAVFLPKEERKQLVAVAEVVGGAVLLALGAYFISIS
jgi:hypothetical protein